MLARCLILNLKNKFKFPINNKKNLLYNAQSFNILQVNKIAKKLTKERLDSIEKRQQELIDEIEGNPTKTDENDDEANQDMMKRIAEDKSHDEMMDRFKESMKILEAPESPLNKKNWEKSKTEFNEVFKGIATYVKPEKKNIIYKNMEKEINSIFKIKKVEPSDRNTKRSGVLAFKVGMTGVWDKYGIYYPLTVLQVDRCQVVQVKTKDKEGE